MRIVIVCLLLFLITGCGSTNTETTENSTKSTEKVNSDVKEETYTREMTDKEQKYTQLILNKDYDNVMKQTRDIDNDYYNIAFSLKEYEEANNVNSNFAD